MKNRLYRITWYDKAQERWRAETYIAISVADAVEQWAGIDACRFYIKPDYFKVELCNDQGVPVL